MAIVKAVNSQAGINRVLDYVTKDEKTESKLITGLHCNPQSVKDEMQTTKLLWGKIDGRTYKHFVISYHPDDHVTPEQAHKNAVKLAKGTKAWRGHEVLLATHIDKDHIHTHIIVNSVNFENGYKLQWSNADLKDLKTRCNELSMSQGLHVPEKGKTFEGDTREETVAWSKDSYNLLKRAEQQQVKSYVMDTALAVLDCKETAINKEDFIAKMQERGYGVDWTDSHKYITYTDLDRQMDGLRCKIRDNKLTNYFNLDFSKEVMIREFESNARTAARAADARQQLSRLDCSAKRENIDSYIGEIKAQVRTAETGRKKREAEQRRQNAQRERAAKEADRIARTIQKEVERNNRYEDICL